MARLDFRLLGPLEACDGGRPLPLGGAKQRAVLARLVLEAGRVVSSDRLIEELWPERPPGRPQTAIQGYVSELRKLLEPEHRPGAPFQILTTQGPGYVLRLEPEQLDLSRFERLFEQGKEALAEGRDEVAARMLREALSLWRGPALADFTYEPWAQREIARLEELRLACLEERIEADLARGRHGELVGELEGLIGEHPLRERLRGQLMLALYRSGRQAEALEAYQQARRTLVDELGIEPSTELRELNGAILRQEAGLALEPPPRAPTPSLPAPATPLIGRRRELAELQAMVDRPDVRLLTLTGAGGSGKTRLALALCEERAHGSDDGVCFCELAPITDPALVLPTIAHALGLREGGGEPLLQRLGGFLRERELLLCLDNLEQVSAAAPDLAELLATVPALRLLVTSRERLHLQAEHEYPVEPLSSEEAVELFVERAQAVRPDFRVTAENAPAVARICLRLDGLPLALELAAARLKLLSPEAMLGRLEHWLELLTGGPRDLPARQQTLRATIEWSYELLAEKEKRLFARLAVFVGGWTLRAAEEIAGGDLETLASLLDKSLIRRRDRRYWMLETIREFAAEELDRSVEQAAIRDGHMRWYASELSQRELAVRDHDVDAVGFVEAELENARAALTHALENQEATTAALLLWGTYTTWLLSGRAVEGARCAEMALAADLPIGGVERVCLLGATGELLRLTGDLERAERLKEAALAAARPLVGETLPGGRTIKAILISYQGDLAELALARGDIAAARDHSRAALAAARAGSDTRALSRALGSAMWTAFEAGDTEQAMTLAAECLGLDRRAGRAVDVADGLVLTSLCRLRVGELGGAGADLADAIGNVRAHPGRSLVFAELLIAAGQLALALGRPADAGVLARLTNKAVRDQSAVLAPALAELLRETQIGPPEVPEVEGDVAVLTEDEALDLAATIAAAAGEYKPADALA